MTNELLQNFSFIAADIADKGQLKQRNMDTIINAAKPTLMGSNHAWTVPFIKQLIQISKTDISNA